MKVKLIFVAFAATFVWSSGVYADECAQLRTDIQAFEEAIAHIEEHGEITKEDAKESADDLRHAKEDFQAMIKSGEADPEEVVIAKRAIKGIDLCLRGLKKNNMKQTIAGMEQILAVMHEYETHAHCGEAAH